MSHRGINYKSEKTGILKTQKCSQAHKCTPPPISQILKDTSDQHGLLADDSVPIDLENSNASYSKV